MENKVTNFLQHRAEISRQWMVLGAVLFVSGLMSVNVLGISWAATDEANVNMNITAGALNMDNAPGNFNYNQGLGGETVFGNTATDGIVINDTTGSGNGWDLTLYYNGNFTNGGVENIVINATDYVNVIANNITIENIAPADISGVDQQANVSIVNANVSNQVALVNATSTNGQGSYNITNLRMDFAIPLTANVEDYTTTMVFTVT